MTREQLRKEHQLIEEVLKNQDEGSLPVPAVVLVDRMQVIENELLCQSLVEPESSPMAEFL